MEITVKDISPFICSFFSPMEIYVADLSAPIKGSVLIFFVQHQVGKVYCVNKNLDANPNFAFFFQFFIFLLLSLLL